MLALQDEYVSGALHHVVLGAGPEGPLQPDTTYFYTCGDPDLGMSPEFSFRTPPVVGPESLPYRSALAQTTHSLSACCTPSIPDQALSLLLLMHDLMPQREHLRKALLSRDCSLPSFTPHQP